MVLVEGILILSGKYNERLLAKSNLFTKYNQYNNNNNKNIMNLSEILAVLERLRILVMMFLK